MQNFTKKDDNTILTIDLDVKNALNNIKICKIIIHNFYFILFDRYIYLVY